MGLKATVEVTGDVLMTRKGGRMQQCYIDLGGKYPEAVTRFIAEEDQPLKPGSYVATKGRIENFRPVIDLRDLTPIPKG